MTDGMGAATREGGGGALQHGTYSRIYVTVRNLEEEKDAVVKYVVSPGPID